MNEPKVRFKEDNGENFPEWEQCTLKDVCIDFIVPMRDKPKIFSGTIPWCRIEDIEGKYFNTSQSEQYVSEKTIKEMNLKIHPPGTVICSCSASLGTYAIASQPLITNQTFIGLVCSDKIYNEYLLYYMMTQTEQLKKEAGGTTILYVSREKFENHAVLVPCLEEQQKIADFLSDVDTLIKTSEQELLKLKELKKGCLQKMFPRGDADVPEVRFPGFTGAWERRKISDVAEVIGGGTPSTSNPEYWGGNINWYTPAEIGDQIYVDSSERKITKLGLEKSSAKVLPAHKTVLFTSRAGIGKTAILRTPASTNQGFQSMVLNDETNPYFIYSMTDLIKEKAERVASGSTFAEISGNRLGNLEFMIPSKAEQDKIGEYFSNLDNFIALQKRECEKYKELKKGLLQQMFV